MLIERERLNLSEEMMLTIRLPKAKWPEAWRAMIEVAPSALDPR